MSSKDRKKLRVLESREREERSAEAGEEQDAKPLDGSQMRSATI